MKNIKIFCIFTIIINFAILFISNKAGAQTWARLYGETGVWRIYDIEEMPGSGFIAAGYYHAQVWLSKMDQSGQIVWEKTYNNV